MDGTIQTVKLDDAYGFIFVPGQRRATYFRAEALRGGLRWNQHLVGLRVRFEIEWTPHGLRACKVMPIPDDLESTRNVAQERRSVEGH
jgi:cold shock CspA family protein